MYKIGMHIPCGRRGRWSLESKKDGSAISLYSTVVRNIDFPCSAYCMTVTSAQGLLGTGR